MISWYFILGVVFAFVMEITVSNGWNPKVPDYQRIKFNNFERLIMICGWPIFLIRTIQNYLNKKS
jgi:uncharacterized membrane protein YphA (DoxX/SURF4 family)|tara:strand:+ start:3432 stop:3626 length:195 start_codon:yes stop_codon:yes gene_type:complete